MFRISVENFVLNFLSVWEKIKFLSWYVFSRTMYITRKSVCYWIRIKNIKIYSMQKTYKIEWRHKVTSYANSTSLFTAYDKKFVNWKLFAPTEDIIKTVMKPFRVALISLLFDVIFITHQLRYHELTTWHSALLVLFTVLGRCQTSLGCLHFL